MADGWRYKHIFNALLDTLLANGRWAAALPSLAFLQERARLALPANLD
jgi:hypothetical protein